jgi:hypothetical protein
MAGNPLIDQGTLNRLRATMTVPNNTQLNVTPAFLGTRGISVRMEGQVTRTLPTMAGTVTSPEPYQLVTVEVHLLKSQALAATYKALIENLSTIGPTTVRPDAVTLPDYTFQNCSVVNTQPTAFDGADAEFMVTIQGYYPLNASLWNA